MNTFNLIKLFSLFLALLFVFPSCQKEEITATKSYPNIPTEFWYYFEKFENSALERGVDLSEAMANITAEIGTTTNSQWAGQCNHNHNQPNNIIINKQFWEGANKMRREKIIFHELGHCLLERGHTEDLLPDGSCKSIMRSGIGDCVDNYNDNTYDYYLDELFLEN